MNIYCPNCEHACSEAAVACPACGHPLATMRRPVQTTEQTAKRWKVIMLIGGSVAVVSASSCFLTASFAANDPGNNGGYALVAVLSAIGFVVGFGTCVVARLCDWWFHG